ncbi:DUF2283 domain-containing protein [Kamptonema cortianum]|nr:DUF2283 domain-containing protein [Oscillatoria laete-virens]MDK3159562.1 DUF2283 domain-containing protein [Kamptonema cortianum]MDL5053300.1 DUF2283 domain-containing protein [Oscillatoria laete-virens NRMC-F 0139]
MKIKYFEDTDTALLEIGKGTPSETRELSEDIYLDLDIDGNVVSITLEHASTHGDLSEFSFLRMNNAETAKRTPSLSR